MGLVPGDDLVSPALERPTKRADFDGPGGVVHVADQLVDEHSGEFVVLDAVELTNGFLLAL
jgi:hypothetical protein